MDTCRNCLAASGLFVIRAGIPFPTTAIMEHNNDVGNNLDKALHRVELAGCGLSSYEDHAG